MNLEIIILAAGKGTRMRSALPKVMQPLSGRPMLAYVLDTAAGLGARQTHVVIGHQARKVKDEFAGLAVNWVDQAEQKGTGHAVAEAMPYVNEDSVVLVLYGDVPLVQGDTLRALLEKSAQGKLAILTIKLDEPAMLGRIIRDENHGVTAIREYKDASDHEREISEVNTGVLAVPTGQLNRWLDRITNDNAQHEYYLTDIVSQAVQDGTGVEAVQARDELEILGVNSKAELAVLERRYQHSKAAVLMEHGVTIVDPARLDVRGELESGQDCVLDINTLIEGRCRFGDNVQIGANCVIRNASIGDNTIVHPFTLIEDAEIGERCRIGPYARLRPGVELKAGARIGNFVEVKNSVIGKNSKANHLSYVGDAEVGGNVNIGAGTITCNYDGANKHKTIIGDNVHIGSDCQLVAPVTVSDNATIGAGTTVFRDAPARELTLNPKDQVILPGWERPVKTKS